MKRGLKRTLKTLAFAAGGLVLLIAGAVLLVIYDKPLVKKSVESFLAKKTGIQLNIGRFDYRLSPLSVEAGSIKVTYATPVYSLEATVRRVALRGALGKLLRGERHALDTLEADIEEIRVDQKIKTPQPIDYQGLIQRLANALNYSPHYSLRCGRMVVLLLHTDFRGDGTTLTISGGHAGGVFDVALNFEDIAWVLNRGKMSIVGPLRVDGELNLGRPAGVDLQLAMARPRIDVAGKAAAADNLSIGLQGTWQTDNRTADIDLHLALDKPRANLAGEAVALDSLTAGLRGRWQPDRISFWFPDVALDVPGLASLEGSLNLDRGGEPAFEAGAKARLPDLEAIARAAAPFLPEALRGVSLRGTADLEAKYTRSQATEGGSGTLSARLEAQAVEWTAKGGGFPLSGRLSGTIQAEGSPADPLLSGDIRLESGKLSGMGAVVDKASAHLRLTGSLQAVKIAVPAATLDGVSVAVSRGKTIAFDKVGVTGIVGVRAGKRPAVDADLETRLPGLAPVMVAGRFGVAPKRLYRARLESRGQQIPAIRGLLEPFLPREISAWDAGGSSRYRARGGCRGTGERPAQAARGPYAYRRAVQRPRLHRRLRGAAASSRLGR